MARYAFFVWKLEELPADANETVRICKAYGIGELCIKFLDGTMKWNVPSQTYDKPLLNYIAVLRANGIEVSGWGYHYPDGAGAQGDAIMERYEKLGFTVYHIDMEREWKRPYGMPKAIEALTDKLKLGGLDVLICSYRFPSVHSELPWSKMANLEKIDGWSPQVYWIGAHNPVAQMTRCMDEYDALGNKRLFYPVGPTWAGSGWDPIEDLPVWREFCESKSISRLYYWRLEWCIKYGRMDLVKAATGIYNEPEPPPPPPPVESNGIPFVILASSTPHVNVRDLPSVAGTDVGNLYPGDEFVVDFVVATDDMWGQIASGEFEGKWTALTYNGVTFAAKKE